MDFAAVKIKAKELFAQASFLTEIRDEEDYDNALALMEELLEDYDEHRTLIGILANAIEEWENVAPEFAEFNQRVAQLDDGVAVLRTLIDQYQLKAEDLKEEIGSKSLVSMILNGTRNLTREHIQALSLRFKLNPAIFFHTTALRLVSTPRTAT
jgi:Predicted transcription regulator containing HTH domain